MREITLKFLVDLYSRHAFDYHCLLKALVVALLGMALGACAWVKAKPGAQHIPLATLETVSDCKKLNITTSKTLSNIAGIGRNTKTQGIELANLARNQAAVIGGDTIVAESPQLAGEQTFGIYLCND